MRTGFGHILVAVTDGSKEKSKGPKKPGRGDQKQTKAFITLGGVRDMAEERRYKEWR